MGIGDNSIPFVNRYNAPLGRVLKALRAYQRAQDEHWPESEWAFDGLTRSDGHLKHVVGLNDEMAGATRKDLKAHVKTMQTLLNKVFDEIQELAEELDNQAKNYHDEIWGEDNEDI